MRLDSVPSEGDVVYLSETSRVNRLAVYSTLSTIRDGNITDALVVNTSNGPISVKTRKGRGYTEFLRDRKQHRKYSSVLLL